MALISNSIISSVLNIYNNGELAYNNTIISGGGQYVCSGGTANVTTVNSNGYMSAYDGAVVSGSIDLHGNLYVENTVNALGATVDFHLESRSEADDVLIGGTGGIVGLSGASYVITVSADQPYGTYKLASGAENFDQTVTLQNTVGTELGVLTVNGGMQTF